MKYYHKLLSRLGFPMVAGDLYALLVKSASVRKTELIEEFGQEALNWLTNRGYVYEEIDEEREIACVSCSPHIVARSLFDRFLWLRKPLTVESKDGAQSALNLEKQEVESYATACKEFSALLNPAYTKVPLQKGFTYVSEKQISPILAQAIQGASRSILGITVPKWTPNLPVIWESLKAKMAEGVTYKRITDEITFLAFGYSINKRDVETIGVNLKIVERSLIDKKFYLIDDKLAIYFSTPPAAPFGFEATLVEHSWFLKLFKQTWKKLWSLGIVAKQALDYLSEIRDIYLLRIRERVDDVALVSILEDVFDFGIFAKIKGGIDQEVAEAVLSRLCNEGILVKLKDVYYPYATMFYIPNLIEEISSFIRSQGRERPIPQFRVN